MGIVLISTDLESGDALIRKASIPGWGVSVVARRPDGVSLAGIAIGPAGPSWVEGDAQGDSIWQARADGIRQRASLPKPLYGIRETERGVLGLDADADVSAIDLIVDGSPATLHPIVEVHRTIESFDVSEDGRSLVYAVSDGPGTKLTFVLVRDGVQVGTVDPPGRLIGAPFLGSLSPSVVLYEDHDEATVKSIDLNTAAVHVILKTDVSEPALNKDGWLAYTGVDQTDKICIAKVA
jgi:hypothetical protein